MVFMYVATLVLLNNVPSFIGLVMSSDIQLDMFFFSVALIMHILPLLSLTLDLCFSVSYVNLFLHI